MSKFYFIKTYGCQMNVHESEKIAGILQKLGYSETDDEKKSDVLVFNTCCIRETAESKILGHIGEARRLKERKPSMIVAVCGCMSQQNGLSATLKKRFPFIDIILGTSNLHLLEDKILNIHQKNHLIDTTEYNTVEEIDSYRTSGANAWVNIIYGCNNFCTYCIVPYVRGRERSRSMDAVLSEVKMLIDQGYKEITLLGQNVNSYGKDLTDGTTFAKLLDKIGQMEGKFRLRFLTSHPKDFTRDIAETMAKYPNICKSIHLPIQSGSTKILKSMNRKYTREQYLEKLDEIRSILPDGVGISGDIMVGFAGETDEDFQETLDLVQKARFSSLFCFIYSRRKGTPGYSMDNQVPKAVKTERIKQLIATQNVITREISKQFEGKTYEILVDGLNDKYKSTYCGRTDCGKLVNFKCDRDLTGQFVNVLIKRSQSATLWGDLVEE